MSTISYEYTTDFSTRYFEIFKDILKETTGEDTPYQKTKDFIALQVNESTLKPREQAEIISAMMANITIGITAQAMQTARNITLQNFKHSADMKIMTNSVKKSDSELKVLTSVEDTKINIQKEQLEKLKKEVEYLNKQIEELPKATKDNNIIQSIRESSQMIATIIAADATPTREMIEHVYRLISLLTQIEEPTEIKVDKNE